MIQELTPQPAEVRFYTICPHCGKPMLLEFGQDKLELDQDNGDDLRFITASKEEANGMRALPLTDEYNI